MKSSSETGRIVKVGLAQFKIGEAPLKMVTMALGSCLGIVLYDGNSRVGALAHVMHPWRSKVRNNVNRAKFVDSAIEMMLIRMIKSGADKKHITAKLFGGARMFQHVVGSRGVMQIGEENVASARQTLALNNIPIVAESTGGEKGRSIHFDLTNGSVVMRDAKDNEVAY